MTLNCIITAIGKELGVSDISEEQRHNIEKILNESDWFPNIRDDVRAIKLMRILKAEADYELSSTIAESNSIIVSKEREKAMELSLRISKLRTYKERLDELYRDYKKLFMALAEMYEDKYRKIIYDIYWRRKKSEYICKTYKITNEEFIQLKSDFDRDLEEIKKTIGLQ